MNFLARLIFLFCLFYFFLFVVPSDVSAVIAIWRDGVSSPTYSTICPEGWGIYCKDTDTGVSSCSGTVYTGDLTPCVDAGVSHSNTCCTLGGGCTAADNTYITLWDYNYAEYCKITTDSKFGTCKFGYSYTTNTCGATDTCRYSPYLYAGACNTACTGQTSCTGSQACTVGGLYKTCCNTNGTVDGECNGGQFTGTCPANTATVICGVSSCDGISGYCTTQPCGSSACRDAFPQPTVTPTPTPTPLPGGCPASGDNCVYSQGSACYSGKTNDTGTCTWVNGVCLNPSAGCSYSCGPVTCPSGSPPPSPVPTSTPPPGSWQGCGSCNVGCGGNNSRSHCFSGSTDMGCQSSFQCRIAPDGSCQWDPGSCTGGGGNMTCLECVFNMARFCEPKTSLITWENPSQDVCGNQWTGYSWGPKGSIIQQNLNDCEYLRETGQGCSGNWSWASVNLNSCICGSSTADATITFSNNNPQAGSAFTVYADSFKNYDQGSGGGSGKGPMIVRLEVYNSANQRVYIREPQRRSTRSVSSYSSGSCSADSWTGCVYSWPDGWKKLDGTPCGTPFSQRRYEWDLNLPSAGTYSFKLSVQELYYVCATNSLTVTAPPPPAVPTLLPVECLTNRDTALNWNPVTGADRYGLRLYRTGYSSTNPLIYEPNLSSPPYPPYHFITSYADRFWWQLRAGNQYGVWSEWSPYSYFNCEEPIRAWIQTTGGDVHSNIRINAPGGP